MNIVINFECPACGFNNTKMIEPSLGVIHQFERCDGEEGGCGSPILLEVNTKIFCAAKAHKLPGVSYPDTSEALH